MNAQTEVDPDATSTPLKLEGPLNIGSAEALLEVMGRYASQASHLRLDLSGIETCDAAGLQLLCSLRNGAVASGKSLRLVAVSEPFTALAQALGVPVESLEIEAGMTKPSEAAVAGTSNQGDTDGV
jgi:anti-anti-sigma factor